MFVEYLAPGGMVDTVARLFGAHPAFELWAPDLCVIEVTSALRKRYLTDPAFTVGHFHDAVEDLLRLQPVVVSACVLATHTVPLADRLTSYDAAYLVLAQARQLPLCTLDSGLAKVAADLGIEVLRPGTPSLEQWLDRANRTG